MATPERRPIGPAKVGAQAPAPNAPVLPPVPKAEDTVPAAEPAPPTPADAAPAAPATPDNVAPVDTESPEYKAGYDLGLAKIDTSSSNFRAGYAAGLGAAGGSAPAEAAPPAAPEVPEAAKAATATALLASFPDDKPFCMDCLAENLTLPQAHARAVGHLRAQLTAERTARTAAETKLAEETGSPPPIRTARSAETGNTSAADADDPKAAAIAQAGAEWDADGKVRKGFSSRASYVNYRAAEISGHHKTANVA